MEKIYLGTRRLLLERVGVFHLLHVTLLDLVHESFAMEEVRVELGGKLSGDGLELVTDQLGVRESAAGGDQVRAPLEDDSSIPEDKTKGEC